MSIVGVKTITARAVFRVRSGYERHSVVKRFALHATKGWRKAGKVERNVERALGRKPYPWKTEVTQAWRRT